MLLNFSKKSYTLKVLGIYTLLVVVGLVIDTVWRSVEAGEFSSIFHTSTVGQIVVTSAISVGYVAMIWAIVTASALNRIAGDKTWRFV